MTARKQAAGNEPLLNQVARKLGRAAGTLTNAAQGLKGNLSALPKAVSANAATSATPRAVKPRVAGEARSAQAKKKIRPAERTKTARVAATSPKRSSVSNRSPRRTKTTRKRTK